MGRSAFSEEVWTALATVGFRPTRAPRSGPGSRSRGAARTSTAPSGALGAPPTTTSKATSATVDVAIRELAHQSGGRDSAERIDRPGDGGRGPARPGPGGAGRPLRLPPLPRVRRGAGRPLGGGRAGRVSELVRSRVQVTLIPQVFLPGTRRPRAMPCARRSRSSSAEDVPGHRDRGGLGRDAPRCACRPARSGAARPVPRDHVVGGQRGGPVANSPWLEGPRALYSQHRVHHGGRPGRILPRPSRHPVLMTPTSRRSRILLLAAALLTASGCASAVQEWVKPGAGQVGRVAGARLREPDHRAAGRTGHRRISSSPSCSPPGRSR